MTGHETAFPFGSTAAQLNCTTDLSVSTIEWLDTQGKVLKTGTDHLLKLTANPTESLMYMCRIRGAFGNQTFNITLTVLPEESALSSAAPAVVVVILLVVLLFVIVTASIFIVR